MNTEHGIEILLSSQLDLLTLRSASSEKVWKPYEDKKIYQQVWPEERAIYNHLSVFDLYIMGIIAKEALFQLFHITRKSEPAL